MNILPITLHQHFPNILVIPSVIHNQHPSNQFILLPAMKINISHTNYSNIWNIRPAINNEHPFNNFTPTYGLLPQLPIINILPTILIFYQQWTINISHTNYSNICNLQPASHIDSYKDSISKKNKHFTNIYSLTSVINAEKIFQHVYSFSRNQYNINIPQHREIYLQQPTYVISTFSNILNPPQERRFLLKCYLIASMKLILIKQAISSF